MTQNILLAVEMRSTDELHDKYYEWIWSMADDPDNDVTADFKSTDPNVDANILAVYANEIKRSYYCGSYAAYIRCGKQKSGLTPDTYACIRSYGSKSGIAVIRDTCNPKYGDCLDTQSYEALIIDAVNDVNGVFPRNEPIAMANIEVATSIMGDLASIIWLYAREPICTITVNVGGVDILTMPVYSFPFLGLPKAPVPMMTLAFHQFKIKFDPPMTNFSISQRGIMVKNGPNLELVQHLIYIPGYDAVAVEGMWGRADKWRQAGNPCDRATGPYLGFSM
jgi:hypothetical protein